jgi:hypothetical protein
MRLSMLRKSSRTCRPRGKSKIPALFAAVFCACHSAPQTLTPKPIATISPEQGAISSKLLPDRNSPQVQLGPNEDFVPPQLARSNPIPDYPAGLLPLHLPQRIVSARVTFDEQGRAIEAVPSPIGETTHDQYEPAFWSAVAEAMHQWHCSPPRIRKFRDGPDADGDGKPDYRILSAQRVFKTFFDVAFTFEVVNGQPVVKSGQ